MCKTDAELRTLYRREPHRIAQLAREVVADAFRRFPQGIDSRRGKGCSACCQTVPDLRLGELDLVAAAVVQLPLEERSQVLPAVREAAAKVREAGNAARAFPLRCPLLDAEGQCRMLRRPPLELPGLGVGVKGSVRCLCDVPMPRATQQALSTIQILEWLVANDKERRRLDRRQRDAVRAQQLGVLTETMDATARAVGKLEDALPVALEARLLGPQPPDHAVDDGR